MNLEQFMVEAEHAMNAKAVFGDVYEKNGLTVLPVAKISGGVGGGGGEDREHNQEGRGSGFGMRAKPTGVYVIRHDAVEWRPAIDWNRIVFGAQAVAIVAMLMIRSLAKIRAKRERRAG